MVMILGDDRMSSYVDVNIITNSRFDAKWLKTDLQEAIRRAHLSKSWNELIKDGELFGEFSDALLNSAGAIARKGIVSSLQFNYYVLYIM